MPKTAAAEEWRPVPHDPRYQVSSLGRVRGVRGSILALSDSQRYYSILIDRRGSPGKRYAVHVLVAEAFLPPRPTPEHEVRHLDRNTHNNAVTNLAWGTRSDNMNDAVRHGTHVSGFSTLTGAWNVQSRLVDSQVIKIRELYATGDWTISGLAREFHVGRTAIHGIVHNKTWRHLL